MKRDYYQFQRDVIDGKAGGKILFQPRIHCWLDDKKFAGEELPGPFKGMTWHKPIHDELECSARLYEFRDCYKVVEDETIQRSQREISELKTEYTIQTPVGSINMIEVRSLTNPGRFPEKWWVETLEDLEVMKYVLERQTWIWDEQLYQNMRKDRGYLGEPAMWMPRVNVQYLYHDIMGTENGIYMLMDYPNEVEDFFRV